ncbi:sodium channel protein 1 brain-like isoform X2 [Actinia tenebrosa]|nr:sodium channel protein 1 brain-like isoform X2 [Actinia tenebrosa]
MGMSLESIKCNDQFHCCFKTTGAKKDTSNTMENPTESNQVTMIAAQAAARAHLKAIEHDRHSREESLKRSQLMLANGSENNDGELIEEQPTVVVPKHLLGVPLRDRDCGEQEAPTFLVIAKKFGKDCVYRFHASKSLYIFSPRNRLRRFVIFLITHQYFELIILLTILTNCVFLAINDPPEEPEFVFAAIYTAEMLLKIVGRGFALHQYAYLRNAWNWLDFSVVVLGYITMLPGVANLSGIRTFRVLRALRTISAVKGLKAMVNTLLKSIMMLSDVLILTTFFLCVFALIGLQFFAGIMTNKCVKNGWPAPPDLYSQYITNKTNHYIFKGDNLAVICGNSSDALNCPVNYTCLPDTGPNPISKFISYEHFGWALLTSVQLVTMDFWESIYNSVIAAKGPLYIFYFLFVIFLGPFYLINLVLAVVSLSYEQETAAMQDEELKATAFAKLKRSASSYAFDGKSEIEPMYEEDILPSLPPEETVSEHFTVESSSHNVIDEDPENPTEPSIWQKIRKVVKALVCNSIFETFITLCILFNTLAMALEHHEMDESFAKVLEVFNYIFTTVFFLEMALKLIAFGLKEYCKNRWNLFDGTIVILSLVDMLLTHTGAISGAGLSVLRTFRLLRVLKLAQSWKTMGALLNTIGKSVGAVGNIIVILGIIVYMFAVVGMQMFRTSYTPDKFDGDRRRWNFEDFGHSFMMIFRILCGKWIEPLWDTMSATDASAVLFVLPAFVIGNFVILNLFLALLLNSFGGDLGSDEETEEDKQKKEEEEAQRERKKKEKRFAKLSRLLGRKSVSGSRSKVGPDEEEENENSEMLRAEDGDENDNKKERANNLHKTKSNDSINNENGIEMKVISKASLEEENQPINKSKSMENENCKSLTTIIDVDRAAQRIREQPDPSTKTTDEQNESNEQNLSNGDLVANGSAPIVPNGKSRLSAGSDRSRKDVSLGDIDSRIPSGSPNHDPKRDTIVTVDTEIVEGESRVRDCCPSFCYCESVCCVSYKESFIRRGWHGLRQHVLNFVEHKYFELFILVMIGVSSLTLAFEDIHIDKKPILKGILDFLNYTFAVTFCVEMLLKLLAFGIVGYFTNLWNCLDSFIVAISLASISGNENLNAFRSLRALRPLRAISRFEGMKIVVNSLVHAVPAISNVLLVCMIFWLIFAIIGFQLFGGKFFKCYDKDNNRYETSVVKTKEDCLNRTAEGARWVNSKVNFDSSFNGFLALFQVATLEGVFEIIHDSVDSVAVNAQPEREASFAAYFYFVIFIIMGAFFFLNLFIGVIIDNFNRLKQEYEDSGSLGFLLTPSQRSWVNTIKKTYNRRPKKQPKRPTSKWRGWIFDLIHQKKFEVFIMSVIMLNMISMMMQHHNQSQGFTNALRYSNYVFTGIFIVEAIIRLTALKFDYFKQAWNLFDFVIVIFSIVGIILDDVLMIKMDFSPGLLRVVRVFRIGRLLRFFEGAKGVRRLLFALVKSLPGLVNIATLLFLIIFIYAIIGMSSFAYVKKTNGITDVVNFETFGNSMLLLFRIGTAAGWNTILDPMMVTYPDCDPNKDPPGSNMGGNCGNPVLAVIYFVSYILLIFLIIVNMYIAVILENFNEAQSQEEIGITDDDLETFICVWEKYDPKATHFIYYYQLSDFLDELDEPMRIPKPNRDKLGSLNVPLKANNRIYCIDLMQSLIRRVIGDMEGIEMEEMDEMMNRLRDKFTSKSNKNEETVRFINDYYDHENQMAIIIQKAYRIHLLKRKIREHCHTKFHKYDRLVDKDGKDAKHSSWKEKQLHHRPEGTASMETVIGMLWYNQGKRHDSARIETTSEAKGKSGEIPVPDKDEETQTEDPDTEIKPKQGSDSKRNSNISNC